LGEDEAGATTTLGVEPFYENQRNRDRIGRLSHLAMTSVPLCHSTICCAFASKCCVPGVCFFR